MLAGKSVLVLMPCYNDWEAVRLLLARINRVAADSGLRIAVLVVDDASSEVPSPEWPGIQLPAVESLRVLQLRCNLGHQRAIALGLYHAHEFTGADAVLVMDGDGEDRPEDIPVLLREFEQSGETAVTFAARTRRMESWVFQFFYRAYKLVHLILTGVEVRVGNFSVLPRTALTRMMAVSDLWNNYSAAVFRARLPKKLVPLARGSRLAGSSRMNFVSLLTHGLSAISVYSEQVSARLLAAASALSAISVGLLAWWGAAWILTGRTPSMTVRALLVTSAGLACFGLASAVLFAFGIISRRAGTNFLLLRDAPYFLMGSRTVPLRASLGSLSTALHGAEGMTTASAGAERE